MCWFQDLCNNLLMILKEEQDSVVDYYRLSDQPKPLKRKQLKNLCEEDSDFKFYSWDIKENYTYITYLRNYRFIFDSAYARKRIKVFSHLSKLLKTRNPFQIKSHHQKMMMRHKNVDRIIQYLKLKILKFLRASPNSMEDIENINQECEAFFIEQAAFVNQQVIKSGEDLAKQAPEAIKSQKKNQTIKTEQKSKQVVKPEDEKDEGLKMSYSQWVVGTEQNTRKI